MSKRRTTIDEFASMANDMYGRNELTRPEIKKLAELKSVQIPSSVWQNKVRRGVFRIGSCAVQNEPKAQASVQPKRQNAGLGAGASIQFIRNDELEYRYSADPRFIPWGKYDDIDAIIRSGKFFPTFVTGLSGNGKTTTIIEAASRNNREVIRVNFTNETCEDDLIGGLRLVNGETVFQYGPVVEAYLRGAILILDEIDVADPNRVLVLQSVLEGKPLFIKKLGKKIEPAKGFNVFATANTKGKGSEDGRFIGTNILNEAFLDRFSITIEFEYPNRRIETKILNAYAKDYGSDMVYNDEQLKEFVSNIVRWAEASRKSFKEGILDEVITTRRLISMIESYFIFNFDVTKVLNYAVSRFDDETKQALLDLYAGLDKNYDYTEDE